MYDCAYVLSSIAEFRDSNLGACIQADAARDAAKATYNAGVLAFAASLILFFGTFITAKILTGEERRRRKAEKIAYGLLVCDHCEVLLNNIKAVAIELERARGTFNVLHGPWPGLSDENCFLIIDNNLIRLPDEFLPAHWQDHALLGKEAMRTVNDARRNVLNVKKRFEICSKMPYTQLFADDFKEVFDLSVNKTKTINYGFYVHLRRECILAASSLNFLLISLGQRKRGKDATFDAEWLDGSYRNICVYLKQPR